MARIVLTSFGSFGDVNPYIGLGLALKARGHTPVLAMPAIYRQVVEPLGLDFKPVRPDLNPDDHVLVRRIMDPRRGPEALFRDLLLPALAAGYEDLSAASAGADLMVTHPATLAGPIVAERRGERWASSVLAPLSFFSVSDPGVPAPAPWVHPLLVKSSFLSRTFLRLTHRVTRHWAAPVQQFRRSIGLPPGANPILDGQHSPHLVVAMFSRVLADPQPDWPANTVVTGPVLYNGAAAPDLSEELERFLANGPPPIVFTLGTSAVEAAGSFYDVSARAVRRLGRRAVLLIGRHPHNRPRNLGDDVLAIEYAPHATLFPRAAAIVHQGGVGTTHQALASGRPTLVVPHAHDQPDNAMRVARLGVSRTLYPHRYSEAAVVRELGALLSDRGYGARAGDVGGCVRQEGGAERACDALESLIATMPGAAGSRAADTKCQGTVP
jgi:UDP:flavonoid glycosyltransferase YjiC (YdhE family)